MRVQDTIPSGFTDFLRSGREKTNEDFILAQFGKHLDDHYVMLRNLTLPEGDEKLGFVLVGPEGVWHIELLHLASLGKNGNIWMHWDYEKQSVQIVPFNDIAVHARSKLAELRAFLGPAGVPAYQVVMVPVAHLPEDFVVPGVERMLRVEEIPHFVQDVVHAQEPETPVNVGKVINLLTGKVKISGTGPLVAAPARGDWLKQRHARFFHLTGQQIVIVSLVASVNLCLLLSFAVLVLTSL